MLISEILVRNGQFPVANKENNLIVGNKEIVDHDLPLSKISQNQGLMTVLANFAYYGYTPSIEGISKLSLLSQVELASFWSTIELALKSITGEKFKVGDHVLYKNFPQEVLDMDEAEYWCRQIFVYLGYPFSFVAQEPKEREALQYNELDLKVLAPSSTATTILNSLVGQKTRWTTIEQEMIDSLIFEHNIQKENSAVNCLNLDSYGFKENGINLMTNFYNQSSIKPSSPNEGTLGYNLNEEQLRVLEYIKKTTKESGNNVEKSVLEAFTIKDATDVIRLALSLSESDIRFSVAKFRNFSRKDRRALMDMLENSNNLIEDVSERPYFFKKFIKKLHPGDYKNKFPNVKKAYHLLYNDKTVSYNAKLESLISSGDKRALDVASQRPGVFVRKLHELYGIYGDNVVKPLSAIVDKLSNHQLLKLKSYIETVNNRKTLMYPPKGNWGRVQLDENNKSKFILKDKLAIQTIINNKLSERLLDTYQCGFNVDNKLKQVKLPTNDQEIGDYGRGTEFDIPDNINFIRTSSYWNSSKNSFVDNTWNFFDENFKEVGVCCWNVNKGERKGITYSVFSGDATNKKTGKAAQLVDLYFKEMEDAGVRYAVWNILSYNNILFSDFNELHAGLQFGGNANGGALFEPSRIALSFELKGKSLTKVIAYLDIKKRKLVFMDVNFKLATQSGERNGDKLEELIPAYMEYLDSLPSYYDLLSTVHDIQGVPAVYSSSDIGVDSEGEVVDEKFFSFIHPNTMLTGKRLLLDNFLKE